MWLIDDIELPGDMLWSDEMTWTNRKQREGMSLAGGVIIQRSTQVAGRPITLTTPQGVWVTRAQVNALRALADTAGTFTVTHPDSRTFTCQFRWGGNTGPVDAAYVLFRSPPADGDPCTMTLRLMIV